MSDAATGRPSPRVSSSSVTSPSPERILLADVLVDLPGAEVRGDVRVPVAEVAHRASDVVPSGLFFCVPGSRVDGHDFAADAAAAGAAVLIVERWLPVEGPTQVLVRSVREAMGPIAAAFFGTPADRMTMVGVTGTNGKTTTTYLMESVFSAAGVAPGLIGTTGARIDGEPVPFSRTTPEAPDLHRLLAQMAARGVRAVAMEVSSHGLDQFRVGGVRYRCAVFTNLTQDHLDYHSSMEEYFAAKARLFAPAMADVAVVNIDSAEGRRLLTTGLPTVSYGLEREADVRAVDVETTDRGLAFRIGDVEVRSRLRGLFNVYNCLATVATARSLDIEDAVTVRGIADLVGVPGRVEPVEEGQEFLVMVDYAHTPDSMENVLQAARPLAAGRLIVVFGCGGDRDRGKRPLMGKAATSLADLSVITSDNPRSEDPLAIIADIEPGAKEGGGEYRIEPDRRTAIRAAVRGARVGDVVVIAGKGHESGQEFLDHVVPFDDRTVAGEELRAMMGER